MILLVAALTFLFMEPVTYASHRWVMHGPGRGVHVSHHRRRPSTTGFERNDLYPLGFAIAGFLTFVLGATIGSPLVVAASMGSAAYGAAYVFVHDVYVHRRLRWFTAEWPLLERLKEAHRCHHLWGGEPYGMLFPVVPAELRRRAAQVSDDPFPASGSLPSHVPAEA